MSERGDRALRDDLVDVVGDIHTCLVLIDRTHDGQRPGLDAAESARLAAALDRIRRAAVRSNNP